MNPTWDRWEAERRFTRSLPNGDDNDLETRVLDREELMELREWFRLNRSLAPSPKYVSNWIYRINRHLYYYQSIHSFKIRINSRKTGRLAVALKLAWT